MPEDFTVADNPDSIGFSSDEAIFKIWPGRLVEVAVLEAELEAVLEALSRAALEGSSSRTGIKEPKEGT